MATRDTRNLQKYPPILFDEARRREFIDPDQLVDFMDLKGGEKVADFGAGAGFFTLPLAHAVGPKGVVCAIDINANNLSIIKGKAELEGLSDQVELVEGNVETGQGLSFAEKSLDVVFLSSVLSQFNSKKQLLDVATRYLKIGGRLVIFEWHQRDMLLGPPAKSRIPKEDVINLLFETNAFKLYRDVEVGFYHYCLIFIRT